MNDISKPVGLTPRERDILFLLAEGEKQACIAMKLKINQQTVSIHHKNIMTKLGAYTSAHAVNIAWRQGIMGPNDKFNLVEIGEIKNEF